MGIQAVGNRRVLGLPHMSDLVAAAIQLTSTEDVSANVERSRTLVREAAAAGASLIGLPENFAYLGSDRDHKLAIAETLPDGGPILSAMQGVARETRTWLLLGGFPERAGDGGTHIRNTSVLLDADGGVAATYRKLHLFDVDVPCGKRFRESETV